MTSPGTSRGEDVTNAPISGGFAVTKSDATVFATPTRALYVGGTGDVTVTMSDGTVLTFSAVAAGTWLWIICTQVRSTGTTATLVLGLY